MKKVDQPLNGFFWSKLPYNYLNFVMVLVIDPCSLNPPLFSNIKNIVNFFQIDVVIGVKNCDIYVHNI